MFQLDQRGTGTHGSPRAETSLPAAGTSSKVPRWQMILDKRQFLDTLRQLKEKYERWLSGGDVREPLTRATLVDPLLEALGWNLSDPTQCIVEDRVPAAEQPDWADYSLLNPDGTVRMVWEAKRADQSLRLRDIKHPAGIWNAVTTKQFVEQALNYAYRKGADWAVLTNGHQLVLLESFRRGQEHLRPGQAKIAFGSFAEMLERSDELWLLNRASVLSGQLDTRFSLEPQPIVVNEHLPTERTAPDIYADRPDWTSVPLAHIPNRESALILEDAEEIYTNLLPVLDLPPTIFSAPTLCQKKKHVLAQAGGRNYIPCVLRDGRIWTFSNLALAPYVALGVCGSQVERSPTLKWETDEDKRRWLTELLHDCLHEHARNRLLEPGRKRRYYFSPAQTTFRRVRYRSFQNRVWRWVVRQDRNSGYWVHTAADLQFVSLGNRFYLQIDPSYVITRDGHEWVDGSIAGPLTTSITSGERNRKYLYHINFWKAWLADEVDQHQSCIQLHCGDAAVSVSTQFVSGMAPFSVPPFGVTYEDLEEEEEMDEEASIK